MRRVVTAVAIVVTVVAATVTPAEAKKKAADTAAALAPLVLSTKDVGKGWSVNTGAPASTPSPTAGPCNGPNAAARAVAAGSTATAEANLIKDPQAGPVIFEVVYGFPTAKQAKEFMATNRAILESCPASDRVNTVNGRTYHDTASAMPFPKIGDDTVAYKQTDAAADGNGSAVSFNDVYVRSGTLVLSMAVGGASVDTTAQYTRKALSKLAARAK
jgi:hypothetical protein